MKKGMAILLVLMIMLTFIGCRAGQLESAPGGHGNNPETTLATPTTPPTTMPLPTTTTPRPTTAPTVPPTTVPVTTAPPVTVPMGPTAPPVAGDRYWAQYEAKSFQLDKEGLLSFEYRLMLYTDGTFTCNGSALSSNIDRGIWILEGDILYLIGMVAGMETGDVSCFRYESGAEDGDGKLYFMKGENDLLELSRIEDGAIYVFRYAKEWD